MYHGICHLLRYCVHIWLPYYTMNEDEFYCRGFVPTLRSTSVASYILLASTISSEPKFQWEIFRFLPTVSMACPIIQSTMRNIDSNPWHGWHLIVIVENWYRWKSYYQSTDQRITPPYIHQISSYTTHIYRSVTLYNSFRIWYRSHFPFHIFRIIFRRSKCWIGCRLIISII